MLTRHAVAIVKDKNCLLQINISLESKSLRYMFNQIADECEKFMLENVNLDRIYFYDENVNLDRIYFYEEERR